MTKNYNFEVNNEYLYITCDNIYNRYNEIERDNKDFYFDYDRHLNLYVYYKGTRYNWLGYNGKSWVFEKDYDEEE